MPLGSHEYLSEQAVSFPPLARGWAVGRASHVRGSGNAQPETSNVFFYRATVDNPSTRSSQHKTGPSVAEGHGLDLDQRAWSGARVDVGAVECTRWLGRWNARVGVGARLTARVCAGACAHRALARMSTRAVCGVQYVRAFWVCVVGFVWCRVGGCGVRRRCVAGVSMLCAASLPLVWRAKRARVSV